MEKKVSREIFGAVTRMGASPWINSISTLGNLKNCGRVTSTNQPTPVIDLVSTGGAAGTVMRMGASPTIKPSSTQPRVDTDTDQSSGRMDEKFIRSTSGMLMRMG